MRGRLPNWFVGLSFVSPWVVGFALFMALPIALSLYYSLSRYSLLDEPLFIGLTNYRELLGDAVFWKSLINTVVYAVIAIPLGTALALLVAWLLSARVRGQSVFRALVFLPSLVPLVAAAMIWSWLFNGELGLINNVIDGVLRPINAALGTDWRGPNWLGDADWVMPALVFMSIWSIGNTVVIYLAALQDVPVALYEAAEIDGVSPAGRFWHVTMPMISPVILFNVVTGIIGTWQVFAVPYIMLGPTGGPNRAGYFYTMYLYDKAFPFGEMGYASAMAWVQMVIILALTAVTMLLSRRFVYYRAG
ncbi:MAG: sugar ABC transporter permease [Planctomycetota bacterium]